VFFLGLLGLALSLQLMLGAAPACAQFPQGWTVTKALAMHGAPRYNPDEDVCFGYAWADAPKGGTLRLGEIGSFDNLNPYLLFGNVAKGLTTYVFDTLMRRGWDEPFTLYPLIAERIAVAPDRSGLSIRVDPRARFHDGTPITANDVLWSFQTLRQYGRPNMRKVYGLVDTAVIENDGRTVTFRLKQGFDRETVMILGMMPVMSASYWQGRSFDKTTLVPPLGSGPYRIDAFEQGRFLTLARVSDYWARDLLANCGHYNFDRIRYDYYRDDSVALQAFEAGMLDLRQEFLAHRWARDYGFVKDRPAEFIGGVFPHGRPPLARFIAFNTRRPPFDQAEARRGLAMLFDFNEVNQRLFFGAYRPLDSLYANTDLAAVSASSSEGRLSTTLTPRMRQAAALRALANAGWHLKAGHLIGHEGQKMRIEILLSDPLDEKIAESWAQKLRRLGVETPIRTVDSAQYLRRLNSFDFDATIIFWRNSLSPGTEQKIYWGSASADQEGSFNYAGIKDPLIDQAIEAMTRANTRDDLIRAAHTVDRAVMDGAYGIPLYYSPNDFIAYRQGLRHPAKTALYGPLIETWWWDHPSKKATMFDTTPLATEAKSR
jgi:ABC-type oligopeptide transport system substrate-binding subunit